MNGMSVTEAVLSRRSVRNFTDRPVPRGVLERVLEKARYSPSSCNFQPWEAAILTGQPLLDLQAKMAAQPPQEPAEYAIQPPGIDASYLARLSESGERQYESLGIARDDKDARRAFIMRNFVGFGAPVLLLSYFPRVMGPPQWADIGMWLQTVMLLLREEGLDSCPQQSLTLYGRLIKEFIGIDDASHIFFCGMAIGYRDHESPVNNYERARVPLSQHLKFIGY
jgi:nitroreductase